MAFPGSMIGALLAGILFKKTANQIYAVGGEILGTGILGGVATYPVVKFLLGKEIAVFFFVVPFLVSTIGRSLIGYFIVQFLTVNESVK